MRTLVGGGGSRWYLSWSPEPTKPNYAEILVRTTDGKFTHEYAQRVRRIAEQGDSALGLEPLAGVRVVPVELMLGPPADPVTLRVMGSGLCRYAEIACHRDRSQSSSFVSNPKRGMSTTAGGPTAIS